MRKILAVTLALVMGGLCLPSAHAEDGVIRIGATVKLINEQGEAIGKMLVDEFDAINKAGGINGHKIQFVMYNDECKSDRGVSNAIKIINELKAHVLIGSHCSSVTLPIVDITNRAKVPQITPASSADGVTKRGSAWIFRIQISERFYKSVLAEYIAETAGKKVAYLTTADAAAQSFTRNVVDYMKKTFNVEPVFSAQANEQEVDYRSYLLKMKAANPEAVVFSGNGPELAKMVTQANEVGIPSSVMRVANSWACVVTFPELAGDNAVGLVHVCPTTPFDTRPHAQAFVKLAKERYGIPLPDQDFAFAYDLVKLLKDALTNAKLTLTDASLEADREAIRDALANTRDFVGLGAKPISFCADPTPQCRDGGRSPYLLQYTKGGKAFETKVLKSVTYDPDFGL